MWIDRSNGGRFTSFYCTAIYHAALNSIIERPSRTSSRETRTTAQWQCPTTTWRTEENGCSVDELCAKLVIERIEQKDSCADATYYYCIGCDSRRANNSRCQALPHAKACHVCIISSYLTLSDFGYLFNYHQTLQCEWPKEWNSVTNALVEMTTEHVVTGQAKAPAVREPSKRKVTNQNAGRVETSFAPPVSSEVPLTAASGSSSATSVTVQSKLSQSWGKSKLTAACQAIVDFHLLRFIVCCSIAFAVLDNGLFIDFVSVL